MSLMPSACNRRRVRLVWHRRASALRRWVRSISPAVRSSNFFGGLRLNHQNGINAATAVCTWHSVSSRFSPPELLPHPRQEQVAQATEDQVALQPLVPSALVLVQPDLGLLVLETALHPPPRERHEQERREQARGRGRTAPAETPAENTADKAAECF